MTRSVRISIRIKILLLLIGVLVSAVALYLYLASKMFYDDKTLLIYELNQTNVRTLGEETDIYLNRILDKMKLLALANGKDNKSVQPIVDLLLQEKEGVLRVGILDRNTLGNIETTVLGESLEPLKLSGQEVQWLDSAKLQNPVPFDEVLQNGIWIKNITPPSPASAETPPIMTVATRAGNRVIFADLSLERLIRSVSRNGIAKLFITDNKGTVLADSSAERVLARESLAENPLILAANASKVVSEVKPFAIAGKKYLGSFYRLSTGGLIAASQVELEAAFVAAQVLLRKSGLFALIVVTAAFLIALIFSHSLTVPIQEMVAATHEVAHGDFSVRVPISTRDELAILGNSFNSMTKDLGDTLEKLKATQNQLIQSERLAAIGQISRSIGHEFGNVLLAIVGNADLALMSNDSEQIKGNVNTILQAAERASIIVRNLQSFSKNKTARAATKPTDLVKATLSLLQHEMTKNSITAVEKCEPCREVEVNSAEIEQVLLNLVINSMHAMPNGGQVEIGTKDDADGKVKLWVKDSGTGIPPEVLPRIFDFAFTTKGEKGSGLGLAISKQIIDEHGGHIEVKTKLGEGTTFEIFLPGKPA